MKERLLEGLFKNNPVFVMLLGMCPTLGVTTSMINGFGMGIATFIVLLMSNVLISVLKKAIPTAVRIPCYIVLIASCVSAIELLMQAYTPSLYQSLGIFIPLIVVNCLILGRAEAYASKNTITNSILDALFMGIGFMFALTLLGAIREILGEGAILGHKFIPEDVPTMLLFIMPPGAFLALAGLIIGVNKLKQ